MQIINIDIFYIQLIRSVEKWYDEHYFEIDNKKFIHLSSVIEHYDPERFRNTKNLYKERVKFLNEIQVDVWENNEAINF